MLVILGHCSWRDNVSVIRGLSGIDVDDTDNSGCSGFDHDTPGLIEFVGEDVLVVGESDNKLNNEFAVSSDNSTTSSPVGMLPSDTIVLLVEADNIRAHLDSSIGFGVCGVEILDVSQAVTSKLQIIGTTSSTTIPKVESLLAMERSTSIRIGNSLIVKLA